MKKAIAFILVISLLLMPSCRSKADACEVIRAFCEAYQLDAGVYSSLATEAEEEYISSEMIYKLYGTEKLPSREFAVALYGKVDTVREVGVFVTSSGDERLELTELIKNRLDFLSSFADGDGFVKNYHGTLVYAFVEDSVRAERVFDSILK